MEARFGLYDLFLTPRMDEVGLFFTYGMRPPVGGFNTVLLRNSGKSLGESKMSKLMSEGICDEVTRTRKLPPSLCHLMPDEVQSPEEAKTVASALATLWDHSKVVEDVRVQRQTQIWWLSLIQRSVSQGWYDKGLKMLEGQMRYIATAPFPDFPVPGLVPGK